MISTFAALLLIVLTLKALTVYIWLRHRYSYWRRHNIAYLKPTLPLGSLKDLLLLNISFGELFQRIYAEPKFLNEKIGGFYIFHTPALIIRDPELIRLILIKNFNTFLNRYEAADAKHDVMGATTLPLAKYPIWRETRKRMSELFTSGKMKQRMYPLMLHVAQDLEAYMARRADDNIIEVKEMCSLFTTDLTAALFYSIDTCSLKFGDSQLRRQTKALFDAGLLRVLHFMVIFFLPQYAHLLRAKVFSNKYANFMRNLVANTLAYRSTKNGDLIDKLRQYQQTLPSLHHAQHPDFIASQVSIILLAGFETSSSLIGFTLYELAKQPTLQTRLREELRLAFAKCQQSSLNYEQLTKLPYLHMVICEALRMYPAAAFINRECTPGTDQVGCSLAPHVDYVIPRGMPAYISILGIQRDPKYWPEPDKFEPERFAVDKIKSIHPMTYIPFGSGPHGCIGSRLGLLQVKLGVVHALKNYRVETCSSTVEKICFNPKTFMLESVDELYLKFVKEPLCKS